GNIHQIRTRLAETRQEEKTMKKKIHGTSHFQIIVILISMVTLSVGVSAQISPGDLTKAHAQFEGMLNCTKCHVLGDKVSNEKCLDCHKEIKSRVDQNKGYHASAEVSGKDCFTCHSEHHGRNFEIVRFDIERFDHQKTGYKLTGAHVKADCKACHDDAHIASADIKNKEYTYLGLKTECVSCHKDVHQNTLSTNCAACHNTEKFSPAPLFDHAKSDFPLRGKHKELDCTGCHAVNYVNGALFQRFKGVAHASCADCHEDPHQGSFGNKCKDCHTEDSFTEFIGSNAFNHSTTHFPLLGKHKRLDCAACHKMEVNTKPERMFKDYVNRDFTSCTTCHKDVHEGNFGQNCKACHNEESFQKVANLDKFNHNQTGYPLEGKHITVDCRKCHETKMTDPVAHQSCIDCHEDFHKGQFITQARVTDCAACHTVNGFQEASYTIVQHQQSKFPLTGAHEATPCNACHWKNETWKFRDIGSRCMDCHQDVHQGKLSEKYYPDHACDKCHVPDAWAEITFEHQVTGFELKGKHKEITCTACHKMDTIVQGQVLLPFMGLKAACSSCHADVHERQFEVAGTTDCNRCHGFEAWKPSEFDHQTARFKLDGAHIKVACDKCHKPEIRDNKTIIQYRLEKFECVDCHS
ncbi:MAG TPA: hypothetical protein VJ508_17625, partial [Saprospiraceae bacterium]|nr:hypothetical protein [Saprospiraceae bacterium]